MIRLTVPTIEKDDLDAVTEALASGFLVQGPRVAAFEEALATNIGVAHVVAVTNCTAALGLALTALGAGAGDLVLVPAYSWIATANVVELCGAQPIFVDIDPRTFNMSAERLAERLTELRRVDATWRRVRVIIPVHAFGQMADMDAIGALASEAKVPVIEDAACAIGATWNGSRAGTRSAIGCFSFHPRKAITTGEGGALTTSDESIANRLRALRNHGLDPTASSPDFIAPGWNDRMTEMQAALGTTQLKKLARIIDARVRLAGRYDTRFANTAVAAPYVPRPSQPVYQSYVALLPKEAAPERATVLKKLRERNVEATIGTIHMPLTTYFRTRYGYRVGDFPTTDDVAARSITLPLFEAMTEAQVDEVAATLLDVLRAI